MIIKKNVYLVLTEYQFLQAVNIATGVYQADEYINVIYLVRNGNRLRGIDANKPMNIDNTQIQVLDGNSPKEITNRILDEKPDHFLFFQEGSAINTYLGHKLAKKGTVISLGPDGYQVFAKFNKRLRLLTFIKDTFMGNKYLFKNKLYSSAVLPFDYYTYGNNKFINNLWITHPEQYIHRAKNKVTILKLPDFSNECISFIAECFNFVEDFPLENVIYFFNQPLWANLINTDFNFIERVLKHFPDKKLIVKLHPLTTSETKLRYEQLKQVSIIISPVPAEVLLLKLKNCIVFTGWSSVLITENKTCNYYFNYPIYKKIDNPNVKQIEILALKHITMINRPDEMKFPN
jgi:hypothetical protein